MPTAAMAEPVVQLWRLLLPKQLLAWARTDKNLVLNAMNDRIEIWAEAEYEALFSEEMDDYSALAEEVLGGSSHAVSETA